MGKLCHNYPTAIITPPSGPTSIHGANDEEVNGMGYEIFVQPFVPFLVRNEIWVNSNTSLT